MAVQENVFVVVDPNNDVHVAFDRAMLTAPLRSVPPKLSVMVTTNRETVDTSASNSNLYRKASWFNDTIRKPLDDCGLEYDIEVSWCQDWQESILVAAKRAGATEIYLPMHSKPYSSRLTFSDSKWELFKRAECPVILVRPNTALQRKVILAAVNFQATKPKQIELNKKILERSHWVAEGYGAELHIVNGYLESLNYPDRGKLVHETGLPSERIHVLQGYTDNVVADVARTIKADVVILGTLGQNGREKSIRGNTAERVISAIKGDAVIINA
ncbi:universal stress protein [Oceanicoccus sp. KOV_DT_Chl]|uniref:universal stress protein n=1 Tax=Oceanicoccus sp. KOV_DT_Chl TaxID=1904639 RepID=UPI000C7BA963|nr:universal stress protein [Oceanicoccus sp. KOV_DT_Chl]